MGDSQFTFKYTGTNQVEVGVLIKSLENISKSLKEISKEANGQESEVSIKPFKEGSFEWIVALTDPQVVSGIGFLANSLSNDGVIETFKGIIDLVTFFKGEDIKEGKHIEGNGYEFTNESGEVKIFEDNAKVVEFKNKGAAIYVENLFLTVSEQDKIDGIKLLDKNNKDLISIPKKVIAETAQKITKVRQGIKQSVSNEQHNNRTITKKNVAIAVTKPDLDGTSTWKVVFEGNKIDVKIEDEQFLREVHQKKHSFVNGSLILVDLAIHQSFDNKINTFTNKSRSVTKFHKFIKLSEQSSLFDTL